MQRNRFILASFICGLASLFYLYEFSLQVSPSVMVNEIMRAFGTDAVGVGLVSSIFYLSYTPVQIFGGISYDLFGPRRVMSIAVLICAMGALVFASAHNMSIALLGRFLMGIGSACSFTGALLLISRWFPAQYFSSISALVQFMCSLGAIAGQIPLAYLVVHFGWEKSVFSFACLGFVLFILFVCFIRDYAPWQRPSQLSKSLRHPLHGFREVLANPQSWYLAIYGFCSWAPMVVFAALWGINFMREGYNFNCQQASYAISVVWLGLGIVSPIVGWLSDNLQNRRLLLISVKFVGLFAVCALLYVPRLPFDITLIVLFLIGGSASGQALSFAVVNDINKRENVGTALGFNNMSLVLGGLILQPLASWLIHFFWRGTMLHGVPVYSFHAYKCAMVILPIVYLIAIIDAVWFIKETHGKQAYSGVHPHPSESSSEDMLSVLSH